MKTPVMEAMAAFRLGPWRCRVWWNLTEPEQSVAAGYGRMLADALSKRYRPAAVSGCGATDLVRMMCESNPQIAAIEVLDKTLCGVVYYPDWK